MVRACSHQIQSKAGDRAALHGGEVLRFVDDHVTVGLAAFEQSAHLVEQDGVGGGPARALGFARSRPGDDLLLFRREDAVRRGGELFAVAE